MGKSGGAGTQLYDYYGTLAGGLCVGPVQGLCSIIVNGSEAWPLGYPWSVGLAIVAGTLYVFDAQTWVCTTSHTATSANAPGSGLEGWTQYYFANPGGVDYNDFQCHRDDGTFIGTIRLYWGSTTQAVDFYLQSANNDGGLGPTNAGNGDQHPPYEGLCYCVLIDFLLGEEVQSGPNIEIVLRRQPNQALVTGGPAGVEDGQANIAAVLCEVLTDENCLGLPTTIIDITTFQNVANWLDANSANYNVSVLIDSNETLRSFLDRILALLDGWIRFNPSTLKIELGVYEHGVAPGTYANAVTLTADCLTKIPKFDTTSWQGTYSRATVRYNSRQIAYQQTSVYADDARAFFVLGTARDQALDRPYITREGQALFHGRETLRVIGHAQMHGSLEVRREFARSIKSGDFVFVDIDLEPGGSTVFQYFRVVTRRIPPTGPMSLELFADNTLAAVPFSGPYPVTPPGQPAVPALTQVRPVCVSQLLSGLQEAVTFLAQRPNNLIAGCQVFFDTSRVLSVAITGIASDSSTGANGIITFASNPGFSVGDFIDVSCSGNSAFNVSLAQVSAVNTSTHTVTYPLITAIAPSTAGSGTITVADYYTTFSSLGTFPSFAAYGTLNANVASGDATVKVNVDTTQADASYFTEQWTANDQNNDTMLLILVQLVGSGTDANQINESSGFGVYEICSVSSTSLVSAGVYQLTVLRGRQGTNATAFTTAHTEAWLMPRALLAFFTNQNFSLIAANRVNSTVPAYAQFRFCPYTYAAQLALSSAANFQFRFPLKSVNAPTITMTSPSGSSISSSGTLPYRALFAGTATDAASNLVELKITAQAPSEANARLIADYQFAQTGSFTFSNYIAFDKPGSWTITILARDADGLQTTKLITASITGTAKCAFPQLYDANGNLLLNIGGDYIHTTTQAVGINQSLFPPSTPAWLAVIAQYLPFGPFNLVSSTPGATIEFITYGVVTNGVKLISPSNFQQAVFEPFALGGLGPFHMLIDPMTVAGGGGVGNVSGVITATYKIFAYATAPGYATSDPVCWELPLLV